MTRPVFRFAPSPNGRLHLGHAASALLNADLARTMDGRLLLRLEDIDPGRSRPELAAAIHADLAWLGLRFDGAVRLQSEHLAAYRERVAALAARGLAYRCFCSRGTIATAASAGRDPDGAPLYPGTCRRLGGRAIATRLADGLPHTWRLDMAAALEAAPGPFRVNGFAPPASCGGAGNRTFRAEAVAEARDAAGGDGTGGGEAADPARWGDAVIARRDVPTSYHLSVVMDDAAQGVTHVVRGADLRAATDLHRLLQALLGLSPPRYLHHPLIRDAGGEKLAKSRGSRALADLRADGLTPEAIRAGLGFAS